MFEDEYETRCVEFKVNGDLKRAMEFETLFSNVAVATTQILSSSTSLAETLLNQHVSKCEINFEFTFVDAQEILRASL